MNDDKANRTEQIAIRVTPGLKASLMKLSEKEQRTLADTVRRILAGAVWCEKRTKA